ncbi:MAG: hypothetical protein H7Y59_15280 [Anaerolineales bacterium]|nr:hypothetical protein [Anaerolineales bacterium]
MENSTIEMIATTLVGLLSGPSGFSIPFVGVISALMHYMPSAALTVDTSISVANFALANGCCICIPIPIAFGVFALFRRKNARSLNLGLIDKEKPRL